MALLAIQVLFLHKYLLIIRYRSGNFLITKLLRMYFRLSDN